jgi:hypothetical protein
MGLLATRLRKCHSVGSAPAALAFANAINIRVSSVEWVSVNAMGFSRIRGRNPIASKDINLMGHRF